MCEFSKVFVGSINVVQQLFVHAFGKGQLYPLHLTFDSGIIVPFDLKWG